MRFTLLVTFLSFFLFGLAFSNSNFDEFVRISESEYDELKSVVGDNYAFSSRGLFSSGSNSFKKIFDSIKQFRPSKFFFGNNKPVYGHPLCIVRGGQKNFNAPLKRLRRDLSSIPFEFSGAQHYNPYRSHQALARKNSERTKVFCVLMYDHNQEDECDADPRDWNHVKQHLWAKHDNECGGFAQSPVNVLTYKSQLTNALRVKCTYNVANSTVTNTGYTLDIAPNNPPAGTCTSPDGKNIYELQGAHFHWGPHDKIGSEHYINGKAYPLELHMVHKNNKYATVAQAQEYADGLMVLAYFFSVNSKQAMNQQYWELISNINNVMAYEKSIPMTIDYSMMGGSLKRRHFFTYQGSLTTPPCSEAVTWVVYMEPLPITSYALQQFRRLLDACQRPITSNFRYLQRMNGRSLILNKV